MAKPTSYAGINKEIDSGMTNMGRIIRDAWVFEIIPETETCEGWELGRLEAMMHQVNNEWDKYGCMPSNLPEELAARHRDIHARWVEKAREGGWSGEISTDDEA